MDKRQLLSVIKPARYTNNEINSVKKDLSKVRLTFALTFPDTYEIGMSNIGMGILYNILNGRDEIACERCYSPWIDYEEILRENKLPLTSLENKMPLGEFDIVGITLQHDLCYTNVLNILDLSGIPLLAADRAEDDPIILGGGPACYNAEPVADFFDALLVGDGEEAVLEICDTVMRLKEAGSKRREIIDALTAIKGVYVPSLFDVKYNDDGTVHEIIPLKEGYDNVEKRVVSDLDAVRYSTKQIVPFIRPVHDRLNIEIARGCIRGCRFCHAGYVYRPYRERSFEGILNAADEGLESTGYENLSLLSLSAGDFSFITELMRVLMERHCSDMVSVSLPSIRPGTTGEALLEEIKRVRMTGFTLAPEAGSERMRRIINKDISEEELLNTADMLFKHGWRRIKLYFMIGLPFETMEDVQGIIDLSVKVKDAAKKHNVKPAINVSVSNFVPKSHTPFQFVAQEPEDSIREKHFFLKKELRQRNIGFKWNDTRLSLLEGVFSRGDRRLAKVTKRAFELGAKFDEWNEIFDITIWERAFTDCGIDMSFYLRERSTDEVMPYDHIDTGVDREFIKEEYKRAQEGTYSEPCTDGCRKCGVCGDEVKLISNSLASYQPKDKKRFRDSVAKKKIRFEYTKQDEAVFIGHLDMQILFIRAFNRAGIHCAFKGGFHPMPKISFGSALSLGLCSISEYAEAEITDFISADEFMERMNLNLPNGLKIRRAYEVPFKKESLFQAITKVVYEADLSSIPELCNDPKRITDSLAHFDSAEEIIMTKTKKHKTKRINVKDFVDSLSLDEAGRKLKVTIRRSEKGELNIFNFLSILFNLEKDAIIASDIIKTESVLNR